MALVNSLLTIFSKAIEVTETLYHVEKTKVASVKAEANDLFLTGYKQFQLLDNNVNSIRVKNQTHSELAVLAAEAAFATGNTVTARRLVEEFLLKSPQRDQFYCRAKITLGLLIDFEANNTYGEASIIQRKLALAELIIALDVATAADNKSRYEFIVFNVSVECWRIVRQFLRANRARFFTVEILKVAQALEIVRGIDKDWLITFYSGVSFCLQDSDNGKTASEILDKAIILAQDAVNRMTETETGKHTEMVQVAKDMEDVHKAIHVAEAREEIAATKAKTRMDRNDVQSDMKRTDYDENVQGSGDDNDAPAEDDDNLPSVHDLHDRLVTLQLKAAQLKDDCKELSEKKQPLVDRINRLYMQRIHALPVDGKRFATSPEVTQSVRTKCLSLLHCMQSGCIPPTEWEATLRSILGDIEAAPPTQSCAETLFDASRIARSLGGSKDGGVLRELSLLFAKKGQDMVRSENMLTATLLVKQDLCTALQMVDNSGNTAIPEASEEGDDNCLMIASQSLMTEKQVAGFAVNNRIEALKLLERVLSVSQNRVKDASLIQEVCVESWNAVYPLIQEHLRKKAHRPIQLISSALNDIDSPLLYLRAQIYYELSKCEEEVDYVVKAHAEAAKGLSLDYGALENVTEHLQKSAAPGAGAAPAGKPAKGDPVAASMTYRKDPMPLRTENPGYDSDRPLDVHMSPLADVLFLRSSLYSTPDNIEDQVITNLQQIRESSSKKYKKEMLSKSSQLMFDSLKDEEGNAMFQQVEEHTDSSVLSAVPSSTSIISRRSSTDEKTHVKSIPLDIIHLVLDGLTGGAKEGDSRERKYQQLLKKTQHRINIMTAIAQFGHVSQADVYRASSGGMGGYSSRKDDDYKSELCHIVEKSLLYVLSHSWKPRDVMVEKLLIGQVNACCMMAESIINRMDSLSVKDDDFIIVRPQETPGVAATPDSALPLGDDEAPPPGSVIVDPRAMGIKCRLSGVGSSSMADAAEELKTGDEVPDNAVTQEMMGIKRMVLKLLDGALFLATQAVDITAVQNVIIFFWNINIHVFRKNLYHMIMPECISFLERAVQSLAVVAAESDRRIIASGKGGTEIGLHPLVDRKLQMSIIEALAMSLIAQGEVSQAIEVAMTGCTNGAPDAPNNPSVYVRKRLCELVCQLSISSGSASAAGGGGNKGKKDAKGSGGVSNDAPIPLFDHPLLNVIGLLVVIEVYGSPMHVDDASKVGAIPGLIEKATQLMKGDVTTAMVSLNSRVNSEKSRVPLTQEENDQFQELLVCCWARLTRANLKVGNIYATNEAAIECMQIVSNGISNPQSNADRESHHSSNEISGRVNKRVWRWASLCERFMGISISRIIRTEGQEKDLQNQLRLASLRHFSLSCQFGQNAGIDALILSSAIDAWNVSIQLVEDVCSSRKGTKSSVHTSLITLQKQILSALLFCKVEEPEDEDEVAMDPENDDDKISLVKLKIYLSIIEEFAQSEEWKQAMETVMDAFDNIPARMQKPLWKWRVIVMSKLGKSVLDGMQKLKENDPTLQARVYAILARSASKKRHQLEAYRKTVEILKDDISRVEYLLETAQWMGAVGLPKAAAMEVIVGAIDALYEIEEQILEEKDDVKDGMSESSRATTRTGKSSSSRKSGGSVAKSRSGSRRGSALLKRSVSRGSSRSVKSEYVVDTSRLNMMQLDQAIRAVAMVVLLDNSSESKLDRCVEGVFFLDRALILWQGEINNQINEVIRKFSEDSSTTSSDQSISSTAAKMTSEQVSKLIEGSKIPSDPVDLVLWTPPKEFDTLMAKATERAPLLVPSKTSLPALQLTVYYLMAMSSTLEKNGFTKSALLCLAWIRVCVLFGCSVDNPEPLLAMLHFKVLSLLSGSNAVLRQSNQTESEGESSPVVSITTSLGISDLTSMEYLTSIIPSVPPPDSEYESIPDPKYIDFNDDPSLSSETRASTTSGRRSRGSRSQNTRPVTAAKGSPYDINTWTQEMTSDVESLFCYIDLCRSMVDMGMLGKARKYAKFVVLQSQSSCNTRAHAMACTLLADIELALGNIADAVNIVLECRGSVESTGDSELLSQQAQILIKSYMSASNIPEAHRVAKQALDVLLRVAMVPLVAGGVECAGSQHMTSKVLLETATGFDLNKSMMSAGFNASLTVSEVGRSQETSTVIAAPVATAGGGTTPAFEFSYEAAEAYLRVAFTYVDSVLVPEKLAQLKIVTKKAKSTAADMRTVQLDTPLIGQLNGTCAYVDTSMIDGILSRCDLVAATVDGPRSYLRAAVLYKTATVSFNILSTFHRGYSKAAGNDRDIYLAWINQGIASAAELLEEVLDIYTGLQTRVPVSERSYTFPNGSGHRIELMSSLARRIAKTEMELCEMLLYLNILRAKFIPPPVLGDPSGKLSVIEKYLEQCRPTTATKGKLDLQSFKASALDKSLLLAATASQWLHVTEEAIEANIMYAAAALAARIEAGEAKSSLCVQWHRKLVLDDEEEMKGGDGESAGDVADIIEKHRALSRQVDMNAMHELEDLVWNALDITKGVRYQKGLTLGAYYLLEASGKGNHAATASYLLAYQNIAAREWLFQLWRSAITPTSEIAASLRRIDMLHSLNISHEAKVQQRLDAEYAFLNESSMVWKRLGITSEPRTVLECPFFSPGTCVLSLQFCPLNKTLFAAAGFPKATPVTDDENDFVSPRAAPGVWYVDKIHLDENNRRSFQILLQQHKSWVDQTTKLVTTYGEGMEDSMDFENDPWTQSSKITDAQRTMIKAEHALEEELRALVEGLSELLAPLLGANSEIGRFVDQTLSRMTLPEGQSINLVLLLGSEELQRLPWEALPITEKFQGIISRDFSASVLGNRLASTPEGRGRVGVSSSGVVCVIDPYGDDPDVLQAPTLSPRLEGHDDIRDEEEAIAKDAVAQTKSVKGNARRCIANAVTSIQRTVASGGEKWAHVLPPERRGGGVSTQDWIAASTAPKIAVAPAGKADKGAPPVSPTSTFTRTVFAYAPGKVVGTLISPRELANLKMSDVGVMLLADLTQTDNSYRRQLTVDSRKGPEEIALENPLVTSVLFSLTGVGCVISNQWCTTPTALELFCIEFWKVFSSGKKSAVEAVGSSRNVCIASGAATDDQALSKGNEPKECEISPAPRRLKRWARYANVVYGIGNSYYTAA